jgi:hypothetical protein
VPGTTMSGLMRPSSVGPRDENGARPSAWSASLSVEIGTTDQLQPLNHPIRISRSITFRGADGDVVLRTMSESLWMN